MAYAPESNFAALFRAFTGEPTSIGAGLTAMMVEESLDDPLLVSTASDIALFPGGGSPARTESFRNSTRGFIELTAVSHVPLAIAYLARMRELRPECFDWRERLAALADHADRALAANTEAMWRQHVAVPAFEGAESRIAALVAHTLTFSIETLRRAGERPETLDFDSLCADFFEYRDGAVPVSMNDAMFATFCLAYVDIAWRIGNWLRDAEIDWRRAMVLVSGQSGRPTAGVTWSSNNMCRLIWKASDEALPAERLYVAPHAPGFTLDAAATDPGRLVELEAVYRRLWCHTRASVEVSRRLFPQAKPYTFSPATASDMPAIANLGDRAACVSRLRRIMEDPQQLLSNCVADYVVDQLRAHANQPGAIEIPGFSDVDWLVRDRHNNDQETNP